MVLIVIGAAATNFTPISPNFNRFQVFSLSSIRKIKEEGVYFSSHLDGRKIFMGPEESMQIQSNIASTIAMAFDECPPIPATYEYVTNSVDRTTRWLERCVKEMNRLNSLEDTINKEQMLFGINQGGVYPEIRIEHAKTISDFDLPGYSIGGLAVGETHEEMYNILEEVVPHLPQNKQTQYIVYHGERRTLVDLENVPVTLHILSPIRYIVMKYDPQDFFASMT